MFGVKNMGIIPKLDELRELTEPVQKWLKANYDLMCEVVISESEVRVLSEELGGTSKEFFDAETSE